MSGAGAAIALEIDVPQGYGLDRDMPPIKVSAPADGGEIEALRAERDRLKAAVDWALGEGALSSRGPRDHIWWRLELRRLAGLTP